MNAKGKWKKADIGRIIEILYLAVVAGYILKLSFDTTLFQISWPVHYEQVIRILACTVLFLKAGFTQAYAGKEWLICLLTCILLKLSWISTGYVFLLDIALLSVGAVGVSYRKILKVGFWIELYVLLLAMLGSFTGCITDLVYSSKEGFRHSFGIIYTTDFATHAVFLFLTGWILFEGVSVVFQIACTVLLAFFIYYYCRARCSTIVLCLFLVSILYYAFTEKYKKHYKFPAIFAKWADRILICVMPLGALLMSHLAFLSGQGNELVNDINEILNGRLALGWAAIKAYGIKPFGTAFNLIGAGGTTATPSNYNFVDCSYILILVRYGFMILLLVCILNICLQRRAIRNGQRKIVLAVAMIAVHSMIEHHLLELAYNLFLLLFFADLTHETEERKPARPIAKKYILYPAVFVLSMTVVIVFPRIVGYLKTIVEVLQMDMEENHIWFIEMITIGALAIGFFLNLAFRIAKALRGKARLHAGWYVSMVILLLGFLCAAVKGEEIIRQGQEEYKSVLEADREIIEILSEAGEETGRLYVDHVPEIYRREFGDSISNGVLAPEGAATRENTTLIADAEPFLHVLTKAGYKYGESSSGRIIYTNSDEAQKILEKAGILFKE